MKQLNFEQENSIDIGFEATAYKNKINISCTDNWCGDTENGFGATVALDLNKEQVVKLRDFLNDWLKETPNKSFNRNCSADASQSG